MASAALSNKRSVRLLYADTFAHAIAEFRTSNSDLTKSTPPIDPSHGRVLVCARVRPRIADDPDDTYASVTASSTTNTIVVHDGGVALNKPFMKHTVFHMSRVFDEHTTNDDICETLLAHWPDMFPTSPDGPFFGTTVFMYGKTGTGKTYTMAGITEFICKNLFAADHGLDVTLTAVEVVTGSKSFIVAKHLILDLFNDGAEASFAEDAEGKVHITGAQERVLDDPEHAMEAVRAAMQARHTVATARNTTSSRSHLVMLFQLRQRATFGGGEVSDTPANLAGDDTAARPGLQLGPVVQTITLVDLAGNENRYDQMYHNAEQTKDAATINQSLAILKDCIRAAATHAKYIPYRGATITRMLKKAFVDPTERTLFMGNLTSLPADLDQAIQTLKYMGLIKWDTKDFMSESKVQLTAPHQERTRSALARRPDHQYGRVVHRPKSAGLHRRQKNEQEGS
ncbi:hypothetical protein AMAG_06658 [Allomyces macrogynus ATCC 38327]|uniref:Kinesin motor domain-containing protein n=1 Tax=Allomyces macrogynus (strain ATCC 38327) TaxID=578462 RepID=A0A0L0SEM0_ALLM3|nr:hypothetical protein AMAG_06658 [Allomyces macrogynus ATCC 38327]|eukprot:KNE60897.1 hypothetical protein AMAG_06658 [Allomyces macrogynus ATCC 38327]